MVPQRMPLAPFEKFTLRSSGGMPSPENPASTCKPDLYGETFTVDAQALTFEWNYCRHDFGSSLSTINKGSRALTSDELTRVRDAFDKLTIGSRGSCGADKPLVTVSVQHPGSETASVYVDEFNFCQPPQPGQTYIMNIDALTDALNGLATKSAQ